MDDVSASRDYVSTAAVEVSDEIDVRAAAESVGTLAARRAAEIDHDGAFPQTDIESLRKAGLLLAPFPPAMGGSGLSLSGGASALHDVLVSIGRGSLALGRLYEGHVNAVALVARYGTHANLKLLLREAHAGRPSGVWMAGPPLKLEGTPGGRALRGFKTLCSGAGHVRRPLVAADDGDGGSLMLLPEVADRSRVDTSRWQAHGMRATASGTVDFSGIAIEPDEIVGNPGDYMRPPYFRGGAWRVLAVQLGGLLAILDQYREQLAQSAHADHPIQLARFGEAVVASETARLWVRHASEVAERPFRQAAAVDACVDLARNAFEAAALGVTARAQKALGLNAFLRPNPLERMIRDLTTYLRQPALDVSLMSAADFHLRRPTGRARS